MESTQRGRSRKVLGSFAQVGAWAAAVCILASAGCATVAPYERERLAASSMQLSTDPLAAELRDHVHEYREGASGGFGGGGGGCGCN